MKGQDCGCTECESYRIEEGAYDRRMGKPVLANPYNVSKAYARQWEVGWLQEDRFLRLGFQD